MQPKIKYTDAIMSPCFDTKTVHARIIIPKAEPIPILSNLCTVGTKMLTASTPKKQPEKRKKKS